MNKKLSELFWTCYTIDYKEAGDDVNYRFVEEGNTLYIYFQGSSSITDWVRNFLFFKKPYKDMKIPYYVHGGFLAAWKEVEDIIFDKITEKVQREPTEFEKMNGVMFAYEYKWKEIVVVGYSHGGALAAFCHESCWFWRSDIADNIYGFGFEAPRIYRGWRVKKALQKRWANFTVIRNKNDLVTHCPPTLFCFCHVGNLLKIGKGLSTKDYHKPHCIGAHYPEAVLASLKAYEGENKDGE